MPLYEYTCGLGHTTEVRAGLDVKHLACPTCGRQATRVAVYADQYISGETVAKGRPTAEKGKGKWKSA